MKSGGNRAHPFVDRDLTVVAEPWIHFTKANNINRLQIVYNFKNFASTIICGIMDKLFAFLCCGIVNSSMIALGLQAHVVDLGSCSYRISGLD